MSAYTAIASQTLTSSASSVTFSSIPGTFRDLVLVVNYTMTASGFVYGTYRFNSDTGNNYSFVYATGNGSSTLSTANTTTFGYLNAGFTANNTEATNSITQIMDYSQTNKHKSVLSRNNRAGAGTEMLATRWGSTAAITTLLVLGNGADFASGSTFSLYGVSA